MGTNIVGILPGKNWGSPADRPIIVGAHWDSVSNTTGFDDNGSGVAVMLEVDLPLLQPDRGVDHFFCSIRNCVLSLPRLKLLHN